MRVLPPFVCAGVCAHPAVEARRKMANTNAPIFFIASSMILD
jgi:hypothetical protein